MVLVTHDLDNFRYQQWQEQEEQTVPPHVLALAFKCPEAVHQSPIWVRVSAAEILTLPLCSCFCDRYLLTDQSPLHHAMSNGLLWNKCVPDVRNQSYLFCGSGYCATIWELISTEFFLTSLFRYNHFETYLNTVVRGHLVKGFSWPLLSSFLVGHTQRLVQTDSLLRDLPSFSLSVTFCYGTLDKILCLTLQKNKLSSLGEKKPI